MTLIIDRRDALGNQPGLHALIAGVSYYPHVAGGRGKRAPDDFGLQQLSACALSAFKVYDWLVTHEEQLALPIATVRLLLSPSRLETTLQPGLAKVAQRCTLERFVKEATAWRKDAATHPDGIALFYFAGHGVQRTKDDAVMLMENFGDGLGGRLSKAASTRNINLGMSPAPGFEKIARTQFYFIDACRVRPDRFNAFELLETGSVFDNPLIGGDDREAPVFYGAEPGELAYASAGKHCLFTRALLDCLDGAALTAMERTPGGQAPWGVTATSLNLSLRDQVDLLNERTMGAAQEYQVTGNFQHAPLVIHKQPPPVSVTIEVDPIEAAACVNLSVLNQRNQRVLDLAPPIHPLPVEQKLAPGLYHIIATINPPHPTFVDFGSIDAVSPPKWKWTVKVDQ